MKRNFRINTNSKTNKKVKQGVATLLTTGLVFSTVPVHAAASQKTMDEVNDILNETTTSADFWMDYIENSDDKTINTYLPQLILKLNEGDTVSNEPVKELKVQYKTVTEGYAWGPGISKLIIKPSVEIDPTTLSADAFNAEVNRVYKDLDFATFTLAEKATDHKADRKIVNAYMSDDAGNADPHGEFITLEMEVGPNIPESSPFNYNILSGFNEYVDTTYNISLTEDSNLRAKTGEKLALESTGKAEYVDDIQVVGDEFVNNQKYSKDGVNLTYASFEPETASDEAGSNPLIIFLHGAGEGGTDTSVALYGTDTTNLATDEIQQYFGDTGAYVLVPQTPTMWMDIDGKGVTYNQSVEGSNGESYYTEALMGLITDYVNAHPEIDKDRIYIGGDSNGGYMTVNLVATYPDYFAAAYPICAPYDAEWITEERLENLSKTPMWFTHAKTDSIVPIIEGEVTPDRMAVIPELDENGQPVLADANTNALYSRLEEAGAEVYYSLYDNVVDTTGYYTNADGTPYEYMGHFSWVYTLNNEPTQVIDGETVTIFEWLGQQSK